MPDISGAQQGMGSPITGPADKHRQSDYQSVRPTLALVAPARAPWKGLACLNSGPADNNVLNTV